MQVHVLIMKVLSCSWSNVSDLIFSSWMKLSLQPTWNISVWSWPSSPTISPDISEFLRMVHSNLKSTDTKWQFHLFLWWRPCSLILNHYSFYEIMTFLSLTCGLHQQSADGVDAWSVHMLNTLTYRYCYIYEGRCLFLIRNIAEVVLKSIKTFKFRINGLIWKVGEWGR